MKITFGWNQNQELLDVKDFSLRRSGDQLFLMATAISDKSGGVWGEGIPVDFSAMKDGESYSIEEFAETMIRADAERVMKSAA